MDLKRSSALFPIACATIIIIFAIVITDTVQSQHTPSFSQVVTVGPIWATDTWSCTSSADFIVHGTLRGLANSQLSIAINGLGTQSLYSLDSGKMQTFDLGSPGGHTMTITRTGTITGWITMQTMSGAKASCTQT